MLGTELPAWRKRNRYTQDMLRMALGISSRQTIISWEKSPEPLSKVVQLALLALEHLPQYRKVDGVRHSVEVSREELARSVHIQP